MSSAQTQEIAEAIAVRHAAMLAGEARSYARAVHAGDANHPTEIAGALQGCRMLGFLEQDAQCIAKAWQYQTQRTSYFNLTEWPCSTQDFGLGQIPQEKAFPTCPHNLGLYAVLPTAEWIDRMVQAGVPTLQLRFKSDDEQTIRREVRAAMRAIAGTSVRLFINDHWQIGIEEGAYGVHLGQEDIDDTPLEPLRAAGVRLGISTHGYAEMLHAEAFQPSYLALGAVFPTTLKRMQTAPQGLGRLFAYAKLMQHKPLVAIGGIDQEQFPVVMQSGVGSIAVVRAITGARDPEAAAKQLLSLMKLK